MLLLSFSHDRNNVLNWISESDECGMHHQQQCVHDNNSNNYRYTSVRHACAMASLDNVHQQQK